MRDQIGLMRAQFVALAAAEERAAAKTRAAILARPNAMARIAAGRGHRSVWYSP